MISEVFVFGTSSKGHLGIKNKNQIEEPTQIESLSGLISSLSASEYHMAACAYNGAVYLWGLLDIGFSFYFILFYLFY